MSWPKRSCTVLGLRRTRASHLSSSTARNAENCLRSFPTSLTNLSSARGARHLSISVRSNSAANSRSSEETPSSVNASPEARSRKGSPDSGIPKKAPARLFPKFLSLFPSGANLHLISCALGGPLQGPIVFVVGRLPWVETHGYSRSAPLGQGQGRDSTLRGCTVSSHGFQPVDHVNHVCLQQERP